MTLDGTGNDADLVGDGDVIHCPPAVWFLVAVLETDVLRSSRDLVHCPFGYWGSSRERDVEWFGCGGRGVEEEDEKGGGDEGDHGG